jgi:hypothetical protein
LRVGLDVGAFPVARLGVTLCHQRLINLDAPVASNRLVVTGL